MGSLLVGDKAFIARARRIRKQLGGGMRQVGVLAAAGMVALETMTARLVEDHTRAKMLAAGLRDIDGIVVDPAVPATNMVFIRTTQDSGVDPEALRNALEERGVRTVRLSDGRLRMVVHYEIDDAAIAYTIEQVVHLFTIKERRHL